MSPSNTAWLPLTSRAQTRLQWLHLNKRDKQIECLSTIKINVWTTLNNSFGLEATKKKNLRCRLSFWKVLIFTTCYRSHSPSRVFEIVKFSVASFSPKQIHRHKTFFFLEPPRLIRNSWANYDPSSTKLSTSMCEIVFCSFNVTFYAWLMEKIGRQTSDDMFTLHSDAKYCYQTSTREITRETRRHSFKASRSSFH